MHTDICQWMSNNECILIFKKIVNWLKFQRVKSVLKYLECDEEFGMHMHMEQDIFLFFFFAKPCMWF